MYTVVATLIATVFMVLPLIIAPSRVDLDKSSAYECGFDAFGEVRGKGGGGQRVCVCVLGGGEGWPCAGALGLGALE